MQHRWVPSFATWLGALCLLLALTACRSAPKLPSVDLSAPGWTMRQGQAVWRRSIHAPEIAGELLVARHAGGLTFVQFTKNPLPFVTAQSTSNRWQIEFVPQRRTLSGTGRPPKKIVWLHLAPCLDEALHATAPWELRRKTDGSWRLDNPETGESLEGFLAP